MDVEAEIRAIRQRTVDAILEGMREDGFTPSPSTLAVFVAWVDGRINDPAEIDAATKGWREYKRARADG